MGLWTGSGPRHTSEYLQAQRKPQEIPERAICLATVPCSREDGDFLDSGMAGVGIIGLWFTALVNYESRCRLIFVFPLFSPLIAGKPPCLPGRWRGWLRPRQQPSAPAFERRRRQEAGDGTTPQATEAAGLDRPSKRFGPPGREGPRSAAKWSAPSKRSFCSSGSDTNRTTVRSLSPAQRPASLPLQMVHYASALMPQAAGAHSSGGRRGMLPRITNSVPLGVKFRHRNSV